MSSFLSNHVLVPVTPLAHFAPAPSGMPDLGSREVQHVLGNTCSDMIDLSEGGDLTMRGGEVWIEGSHYTEVVDRPSTSLPTPVVTIKPTMTVVEEILETITARATLQVRKAQPEAQAIASLLGPLGFSSTDVNSQINAAKSEASRVFSVSISQLSDRFQASMVNLQSSASSAVSQANVNMQMALQASSSAKQAADSANSSLMSIQASASSAISVASAQMQSASMSAGSAVSRAQAMVSAADSRAQQQVDLSQTQAQAAAHIALAVVVSVVATSLITIIGFFFLSRRRSRKSMEENASTRLPRYDEKRASHSSYHDDRYPQATKTVSRSRSRSRSSRRRPEVINIAIRSRSRSRSPYKKQKVTDDISQPTSRSRSPYQKQQVTNTISQLRSSSRSRSPNRTQQVADITPPPRSRSPHRKPQVLNTASRPRSPQFKEENLNNQPQQASAFIEKKGPESTMREVRDEYKIRDSEFSFNARKPVFSQQEWLPREQSMTPLPREPNNIAVLSNDKRQKYITPTFVSRYAKDRPNGPPIVNGGFGSRPNAGRKNSGIVDIGLAA